MAFWGDYHTHTTYSHGKGSVLDNARVAEQKGLKQIAITDHGLRHIIFGIRRRQLPKLRRDCEEATRVTNVLVLAGVENNLNSFDGTFDLKTADVDKLDIVLGGYHKAALAPTFGQEFSFQIRNMFRSFCTKSPKKLIAKNTDAYLKLIDNYDIDFISHINRDIRADALTVARYAKQKGTYVELNGKRLPFSDAEIEKMTEEGVLFVCNSDAHTPNRVGDMGLAAAAVERLHIPYEQIGNWEKFPNFRSNNYKRACEKAAALSTENDGQSAPYGGQLDNV